MNCNSIYASDLCRYLTRFNCLFSAFSTYSVSMSKFNLCKATFCYVCRSCNGLFLCTCGNHNRMNYNRILDFLSGILRNCSGNYYLKIMVLDNSRHVRIVIFLCFNLCGNVFYIIINNRSGLCFCCRSLFFYCLFSILFREFLEICGYGLIICGSKDWSCLCYRSRFFLNHCHESGSFHYGFSRRFHYRSCSNLSSRLFYLRFFSNRCGSGLCTCNGCKDEINFISLSACNNVCSSCILYDALGKRTSRSGFCYLFGNRFCYGSGFCYGSCFFCHIKGMGISVRTCGFTVVTLCALLGITLNNCNCNVTLVTCCTNRLFCLGSYFFYGSCFGSGCYYGSNNCHRLNNIISLCAGDNLCSVHVLKDDRNTRTEKLVDLKNKSILKRIICTNELYDLFNNSILFFTKVDIATIDKLGNSLASFILGSLGEAFDHLDKLGILISARIKERRKVFSIENDCNSAVINGLGLFFNYRLGSNCLGLCAGLNKAIAITSCKLCECLIKFSGISGGPCFLLKAFLNEVIEWASKRSLCRLSTFGCESRILFSFLCSGSCHRLCCGFLCVSFFYGRLFYSSCCRNKLVNISSLSAFNNESRIRILNNTFVKRTNNSRFLCLFFSSRLFYCFGNGFCRRSFNRCFRYRSGFFFCFCYGSSNRLINNVNLSTGNNVRGLGALYDTLGKRTTNNSLLCLFFYSRLFYCFGNVFCRRSFNRCFSFRSGFFLCLCYRRSNRLINNVNLSTGNNVRGLGALYDTLGKRTTNNSLLCLFFYSRLFYCFGNGFCRGSFNRCFSFRSSFFFCFCYGSSFFCRSSIYCINISGNCHSHKSITLGLGLFLRAGDNFSGIYILEDVGEIRTKNEFFAFSGLNICTNFSLGCNRSDFFCRISSLRSVFFFNYACIRSFFASCSCKAYSLSCISSSFLRIFSSFLCIFSSALLILIGCLSF